MALSYVTLVLDLYDGSGQPVASGTVVCTPNATITDTADHIVITQSPVTVNLAKGAVQSVQLAATDNTGLSPTGWAWLIQPRFPGAPDGQLYALPYSAGATQYLSELLPVSSAPVTAGYMPVTGGTFSGAVILAADPTVPLGAVTKEYADALSFGAGGTVIDSSAADIQPVGRTAIAGSTGKAADAGHGHVLPGITALGDTLYGGASGALTRLAGNTAATRKFMAQTGTGSASAAPAWAGIQVSDLPPGLVSGAVSPLAAPFNASPGTGADCATAINSALTAAAAFGGSVYLTAALGIWTTLSPVMIPPCVSVITDGAQENTTYLASSLGTIIQPGASWSQGSCPANAVIAIMGQSDGSYSVAANDQKITGLYVDCHLLPGSLSSTDGVQLYGGTGRTHLERVLIGHAPNCGFSTVQDTGGSSPGSFRLDRVAARYAGNAASPAQGHGFLIYKTSDVTLRDCLAENCSGDGFNVTNLSNGELLACRSEHNGTTTGGTTAGNGYTFTCTNSGTGSGTAIFSGCTSDRNEAHGIEILSTNGSGVPVQLVGCRFRRDGRAGGTGGGSFAGAYVHAFPGTVQLAGTDVFPGVNDGYPSPAETNSPDIGLRIASNSGGYVQVSGACWIQGANSRLSDDNSSAAVLYDTASLGATGGTGSPVVAGPRQGTAALSGGQVTVACTAVRASGSRIFVTPSSTGANSGSLGVTSTVANTSFTVKSTNGSDGNTFFWFIANI